jgi:hypothetical protein
MPQIQRNTYPGPTRADQQLYNSRDYSIRSERQLMEQLDHNLLFHWFVCWTVGGRTGVGREYFQEEPRPSARGRCGPDPAGRPEDGGGERFSPREKRASAQELSLLARRQVGQTRRSLRNAPLDLGRHEREMQAIRRIVSHWTGRASSSVIAPRRHVAGDAERISKLHSGTLAGPVNIMLYT